MPTIKTGTADGSPSPRFSQPLQQVLQSVEGLVAKIIAVIIIITTGLTLAFGDSSGGFRRPWRGVMVVEAEVSPINTSL